jgi:NADPH:quinone reductase-like Zn-dependent oxidoreductase
LEYRLKPGSGIQALEPRSTDTSDVAAAPGHVRVAVHAVALNARDLLIADGHYPVPHDRSIVMCSDGAGVVTDIGPGVTRFVVGERVVGSFFRDWHAGAATASSVAISHGCEIDGWLATEAAVSADCLVRVPDSMSFAEAACAPCAGVTAWNALFDFAQLEPGATVVVQGTGGVAVWAAQLASAASIRCIGTSSSNEKLARIREIEHADRINYTSHDWATEVRRLTDQRGADLVLELGGRDTIDQSLKAAAFGGRIAAIGGLSGWQYANIQPLDLIARQLTLRGIHVGSTSTLEALLRFADEKRLKPLISATYPFDKTREAFAKFREARHVGKIVVQVR